MHVIVGQDRGHDAGHHRRVLRGGAITDQPLVRGLGQNGFDFGLRRRITIQRHLQPIIQFAKIRILAHHLGIAPRVEPAQRHPQPDQHLGHQRLKKHLAPRAAKRACAPLRMGLQRGTRRWPIGARPLRRHRMPAAFQLLRKAHNTVINRPDRILRHARLGCHQDRQDHPITCRQC